MCQGFDSRVLVVQKHTSCPSFVTVPKISISYFVGTRRVPKSHASRILIAGFWLFTNIFMSVFVGNMAAFLMTSRLKTEINSVSDLIKQHTIHYSVWRDSSVATHIKNMKSIEVFFDEKWTNDTLNSEELPPKELRVWKYPLQVQYSTLWDRIVQHGFVNTTEDALQRIKQGNYMFITDSAVAEFLAGSNCNLKVIGKKFSARPYGFGVKKYSSIKEQFAKAYVSKIIINVPRTLYICLIRNVARVLLFSLSYGDLDENWE